MIQYFVSFLVLFISIFSTLSIAAENKCNKALVIPIAEEYAVVIQRNGLFSIEQKQAQTGPKISDSLQDLYLKLSSYYDKRNSKVLTPGDLHDLANGYAAFYAEIGVPMDVVGTDVSFINKLSSRRYWENNLTRFLTEVAESHNLVPKFRFSSEYFERDTSRFSFDPSNLNVEVILGEIPEIDPKTGRTRLASVVAHELFHWSNFILSQSGHPEVWPNHFIESAEGSLVRRVSGFSPFELTSLQLGRVAYDFVIQKYARRIYRIEEAKAFFIQAYIDFIQLSEDLKTGISMENLLTRITQTFFHTAISLTMLETHLAIYEDFLRPGTQSHVVQKEKVLVLDQSDKTGFVVLMDPNRLQNNNLKAEISRARALNLGGLRIIETQLVPHLVSLEPALLRVRDKYGLNYQLNPGLPLKVKDLLEVIENWKQYLR